MRFMGLDLNLLVALHMLLEERSVSAAAQRLNLSQPAMSAALTRLRQALGDEILVAYGKRMVPTAHAEALAPMVAELLAGIEALVLTSSAFDPATSTRRFRCSASDYMTAVVIAPLLARIAPRAPNLRIEIMPPDEAPALGLERGEIDLLFTPDLYLSPDHPAEPIFDEPHVVVGWNGNPVFGAPLTQEAFLAHGHVIVEFGRTRQPSFAESTMLALGHRRRIEVVAPSFAAVPLLLPHTQRLAIMHARLAEIFARTLPLAIAPMPFAFPALHEMVQYHRTRGKDGGLRWLLGEIRAMASALALPVELSDAPSIDAMDG